MEIRTAPAPSPKNQGSGLWYGKGPELETEQAVEKRGAGVPRVLCTCWPDKMRHGREWEALRGRLDDSSEGKSDLGDDGEGTPHTQTPVVIYYRGGDHLRGGFLGNILTEIPVARTIIGEEFNMIL
ncbi:hypothetical protein NDU88_003674 [Pleurodeles waltl]|uniref:Uncharacterized protein n=1 Tax=Pleurodeles waltl TaxID=8319 RepID=A0AAV7TP96_PLEWA|nr:hypothetical protein NDU88_003674 [Pleurodeles waltl]